MRGGMEDVASVRIMGMTHPCIRVPSPRGYPHFHVVEQANSAALSMMTVYAPNKCAFSEQFSTDNLCQKTEENALV